MTTPDDETNETLAAQRAAVWPPAVTDDEVAASMAEMYALLDEAGVGLGPGQPGEWVDMMLAEVVRLRPGVAARLPDLLTARGISGDDGR